jgi:CRISPR-associated protein Csd1
MSWFNNLVETYDRVSDIAGVADAKGCVLWPLNHMVAKSAVCVTIDREGRFRHAEAQEMRIIIPYTEASASRTGNLAPHPLHEQLKFLALDEDKRAKYLEQLATWKDSHAKVTAVYQYILGGTLTDDLQKSGIKTEDGIIRFRVEIPDDMTPSLWEDKDVIQAWETYCANALTDNEALCYATGRFAPRAGKHLKGINPITYNALLISCDDNSNFTYRGRFTKAWQANAISTNASHKAHAMLNYLIVSQGHRCGSQAVVAWAIDDGKAVPDPFKSSDALGIYEDAADETGKGAQWELGTAFAKKIRDALRGRGTVESLKNNARKVAIIATDAATTGRMSITFYQELNEAEYFDRLVAWHESCCWWMNINKRKLISAPSINRIIEVVFGEKKGDNYEKIQKQARERLLHHIVCDEPLDRGWISAAVARVSNPFSFDKKDSGWDEWRWRNTVNVACAVVRKYYHDKKEEFALELEPSCRDRDYLFGRLLAIADKLESHARYVQGSDGSDKRPTNAVRYMSAFVSKPLRTWGLIYNQLNPYIQRLNGAEGYQRQIDEIMSLFNPGELNDTRSLGGKYLLGYSLQRRALGNKKEESSDELNEEN